MQTLSELTLRHVLERSLCLHGDRPALGWVDGEVLSFAQVGVRVKQVQRLLLRSGFRPGDRVAICGENMPNWGVAFFAATSMGGVAVPILTDFQPGAISNILKHSGARVLLVSRRLCDKIKELDTTCVRACFLLDDFTPVLRDQGGDPCTEKFRPRKAFPRDESGGMDLSGPGGGGVRVREQDTATIIYTSGTTGSSKGVMLSHRNVVFGALSANAIGGVGSSDRMLSILPLAHVYECTLGLVIPFLQGAPVYYLDKPPTARVLLPALQRIRPTMMLSVPLVIEKIYKSRIHKELNRNRLLRLLGSAMPTRKLLHRAAGRKLRASFGGKLRFFGIGGAALAPEVERFLREAGFPYAIGYGLTECSPLVAGSNRHTTRLRRIGRAVPGVGIRIKDPDPVTGVGEVQVRGDNVMQGYYREPGMTREAFTDDGWFRTQDLGVVDGDNYLQLRGRIKNIILGPSGENIYPEEIETICTQNPYTLDCLVYAVDNKLCMRVHLDYERLNELFAQLKVGRDHVGEHIRDLLEKLRQEVNSKVATFCRVHHIFEQREPFEKTPTKKIKRYLYVG